MTIAEALAGLETGGSPVPVCHPPYRGKSETYVCYSLTGESVIYAESGRGESGTRWGVSLFCPAGDFAALLAETVRLLNAAGYAVAVDSEYYDETTDRNRLLLSAVGSGGGYG